MTAFIQDLSVSPLLMYGLIAGMLASLACSLVGPYVLGKKLIFMASAIAHMSIGGIGLAVFINSNLSGNLPEISPLLGAALFAVLGSTLLAWLNDVVTDHLEALTGALWSLGMSIGIILMKYSPGYQSELIQYLFGNISVVSMKDLWLLGILDMVILLLVLTFHKQFLAICLDEQQAELQGLPVLRIRMLLYATLALAVISLINVVGLVLILALLTLPSATMALFVRRAPALVLCSGLLCVFLTTIPRAAVYGTRISPESAIVISSGIIFMIGLLQHCLRRKFWRA